jgi:hypothetical protein
MHASPEYHLGCVKVVKRDIHLEEYGLRWRRMRID